MTLQALYNDATPRQISEGWEWYPKARGVAAQMHEHLPTAVGVIAALSPRMKWERNLEIADELIKTGDIKSGVLSANKYKAQLILDSWDKQLMWHDPLDWLRGVKVLAFYDAILDPFGNTDPVVDSHMLRAYYGKTTKPTTRRIREVQDEIRNLAKAEGIPVHVAQAIVWLKVRA